LSANSVDGRSVLPESADRRFRGVAHGYVRLGLCAMASRRSRVGENSPRD
jgi:hypothetical protein